MLQRLHERLCDGVEALVVVADAPQPVWFPREHHLRRVTGRRVLNPASSQQVGQLAAQFCELPFGQPLDRPGSAKWASYQSRERARYPGLEGGRVAAQRGRRRTRL